MRITQGHFFGEITMNRDVRSGKKFFCYYIGRLPDEERLFDGAAADGKEAVETVTAHLKMLTSKLRSHNKTKPALVGEKKRRR